MSLANERNTLARTGSTLALGIAANVLIYAGALVCLTATGYATPGATALGLKGLGRAKSTVDNSSGNAGDQTIEVEKGVFLYGNSAGADEVTIAERDQVCYVVDDETVAKTSGGGTRSRAGFVVDVDDRGVWVQLGIGLLDAPAGALAAANNLSDVGAAATARANIGANKRYVQLRADDIKGADAKVYGFVAPCAGTVTKIVSNLQGHALTTGDVTLTGKIGAVAITNGVVTITQAGSAIGDKDTAVPTAANVIAQGDYVSLTVGGTNDNAAAFAELAVEITF